MIQVREAYQVRFGRIDQAVGHWMRLAKEQDKFPAVCTQFELLADLSGDMFNLIVARHLDSIDAWEQTTAALATDSAYQEWFKPVSQLISDGHREYLRVEWPNEGWSGGRRRRRAQLLPGARMARAGSARTAAILRGDAGRSGRGGAPPHPERTQRAHVQRHDRGRNDATSETGTITGGRCSASRSFQVWFHRLTACVSHGSNAFFTVAGISG